MSTRESYRRLPSVDRVLAQQEVRDLLQSYDHESVVALVRRELDISRQSVGSGGTAPTLGDIANAVSQRAREEWRTRPQRLINATGVVLHTNLGRAPLSAEAAQAALQVAQGYTDLELDLTDGKRGSRQAHATALLSQLTGAEAALVVNNNASAVLLALAAIADGREVIVSRGEAVEIGGGFRIPDIMARSGATLVEVGTTNRTYVADYERAVTENTAVILKVHASNFRVSGFIHATTIEEVVGLGRERGIPVLHDMGSGCLLDTAQFGLEHEPMPQESIAAGCDLALFSGDKLLGGPQAGIVVGQRELVQRLASHPLHRAMRIDKLSLAALTATLLHYLKGEATQAVPIWRMIATPIEALEKRARGWQKAVGKRASVAEGESTIGGGSLPGETLSTRLLALSADAIPGGADALAQRLRQADPPVIGRIEDGRVLLDPRTVLPEEEEPLLRAVKAAVE